MKQLSCFFCLLCGLLLNFNSVGQAQSVLSEGKWYKLAITESNIYAIGGSNLESYGISLSDLDPSKIRLFGNPGGMLPQVNSDWRPTDLVEMAIMVEDGNDGSFDASDKVLFFAEGPDRTYLEETSQLITYENNIYSDTSYYFLNINQTAGKRIEQAPPISGSYPIVNSHITYFVHELDQSNVLQSGRSWYGEKFDSSLDQTFTTNIKNWISGTSLKLSSSVMASSFNTSLFTVKINGNAIGTHELAGIPEGQYSIKGIDDNKVFSLILSEPNDTNLEVQYTYEKQNGLGYLNFFVVQVEQPIEFNNEVRTITIPKQAQPISTLTVQGTEANMILWDVSSFNNVHSMQYQTSGNQLQTAIETDTTSYLALFNSSINLPAPEFKSEIKNQNLHGISNAELLIVTAPEFLSEALRLRNHKLSIGMETVVATTHQIYNEFSAGRKDVTAIRDYAKYLYDNAGLKYLLLFGKGTYDYKNLEGHSNSFVPIYESHNSLSPLYTYGSDDYLGFMAEEEGTWEENTSGDHTMDIGVGRLPVKSVEEAKHLVDKIIDYQNKNPLGNWKKKVYLVAENGDGNIHQRDAERLSILIDTTYSAFDPQKIYVDAYPIEVFPSTTKAPLVNDAITEAIESGAFIVNYTGHGSENQWAKSQILTKDMINEFSNDFYPLFVTATCEFGRHDDANKISAGEDLLLAPNAGAIGLITTSRPVFASSNYTLNLAFYNQVFSTSSGTYKRLGDIFMETKNSSLNGPNNRNFSLLADPSMSLSYPELIIGLDSLNGVELQAKDTVKALEKVVFKGSVKNSDGSVNTSFNGQVSIKFYDRPTLKKTLGNFGSPFNYQDRDNSFFSGISTVTNGWFQFEFIVPLDISYQYDISKVSMYANSIDSTDANGACISIAIGGSNPNPAIDTEPPIMKLFMEDTSFKNNDLVSSNSLLIAHISDESGINLSKSQVGHHISYSLDNNEPKSLNDYFEYDIDTYQNGKVLFPFQGLAPGNHTLSVTVWDVYNNASEEVIGFYVASDEDVVLSEVSAFPNPVKDQTTFTFKHNLSGNEIEVILKILSRTGQTIYTQQNYYQEASSTINDLNWNGRNATGQKIIEGIYIYSIHIRSIDSGAESSYFGRLMTVN